MTGQSRHKQTIKIRSEIEATKNRAQGNAPIGDHPKRIFVAAQRFQSWKHIRIDFPTGMLIKFLVDDLCKLVEAWLVVLFNKRAQ